MIWHSLEGQCPCKSKEAAEFVVGIVARDRVYEWEVNVRMASLLLMWYSGFRGATSSDYSLYCECYLDFGVVKVKCMLEIRFSWVMAGLQVRWFHSQCELSSLHICIYIYIYTYIVVLVHEKATITRRSKIWLVHLSWYKSIQRNMRRVEVL